MRTDVEGIDFKILNLKNLTKGKKAKIKDYKVREIFVNQDTTENNQILQTAADYWCSLQDFRDRRERARKYYRGDQWYEKMEDPDNPGETITEEQYIKNQGKIPFKQNIIRQLVKNVIGQYALNPTDSMVITRNRETQSEGEMMSQVLRSAKDLNRTDKLDTRNWEEFMISGLPAQKVGYKFWQERDREDLFIQNINPSRFFFNSDISDVRLIDINFIGEIKDVDIDELISAFAQNEGEAEVIRGWYQNKDRMNTIIDYNGLSPERIEHLDFYIADGEKARLIEVWDLRSEFRLYYHDYISGDAGFTKRTEKEITLINQARIQAAAQQGMPQDEVPLIDFWQKLDRFWYVKFLTPFGNVLYEGETPYTHKSHPYSFLAYPLLDGEVWGLVEDIIDQQRYINRLISLIDFIMGSSAKGVLLVPEEGIPDDMDIDDYAEEWTKFNGVIKFKSKPGVQLPKQISTAATNIGAMDMLSLQMKLVQDISGVSSAIQGQTPKSGTPSSLYAQEAQNSSINIKDYMDEYSEYKRDRDLKALKVIMQYYGEERVITVPGTRNASVQYDPKKIENLEFDIVVSQSQDTPVYRQLVDDTLFKLLESQMIDLGMYLENSSLPFADNLLQQIKQRQENVQSGQEGAQGVDPALLEQISQGQQQIPEGDANQQAVVNKLLEGANQGLQ